MKWIKVIEKGFKGLLTTLSAVILAQLPDITNFLVSLLPEEYAKMTVAGFIAFFINASANYLKHKKR